MSQKLDGLERIVPSTVFDAPVGHYTTFRIGGRALAACRVADKTELAGALAFLREREVPYRIIGKGLNLLFPDGGYAGVLLVLGDGFSHLEILKDGLFSVGAGMSLPRMANIIAREGLGGLEFSAQIPGSVGGSVAVNAGAFAQELHTRLVSVKAVNRMGEELDLPASALKGCYRTTALKGHQDLILTEATFQTEPGDPRDVQRKQKDYGIYREKTQPLAMPSAGCIFKNPGHGTSAGALIDRLGLKGSAVGDACVSDRHANFIVNLGKARAADVIELIKRVQARAMSVEGIKLEPEIEYVGTWDLARAA